MKERERRCVWARLMVEPAEQRVVAMKICASAINFVCTAFTMLHREVLLTTHDNHVK